MNVFHEEGKQGQHNSQSGNGILIQQYWYLIFGLQLYNNYCTPLNCYITLLFNEKWNIPPLHDPRISPSLDLSLILYLSLLGKVKNMTIDLHQYHSILLKIEEDVLKSYSVLCLDLGQKLFYPMSHAVNFMTARPSSGVPLDISYCSSEMRSLQRAQAFNCTSSQFVH